MRTNKVYFILILILFLVSCSEIFIGPNPNKDNNDSTSDTREQYELSIPDSITLNDSSSATLSIFFNKKPSRTIKVEIKNIFSELSFTKTSLTFNENNYNTVQSISLIQTGLKKCNYLDEDYTVDVNIDGRYYKKLNIKVFDNCKLVYISPAWTPSGGIAIADSVCDDSGNKPAGISSPFKAMLASEDPDISNQRIAKGESGQYDWVFKPGYEYYRATDNEIIFTAENNGLFTFGPPMNKILNNSFGNNTGDVFTNLNIDWTSNGKHCNYWKNGTSLYKAVVGNLSTIYSNSISSSTINCDTTNIKLICIQQ